MPKEIKATYELLKGYKNYPTNCLLALSEFIDNSIGSYQNNDDNNPIFGLRIDITLDISNDKNIKLTILDNARGMSASELENSMQPNDTINKSDTQYNQYGVGMKLGLFYFGENITIYSKKEFMNENYLTLNTFNREVEMKNVVVEASPSYNDVIQTNSGTKIEISHVYKERNFHAIRGGIDFIINGLGWRYNKLLQKGLKIKLSIKSNDPKKNAEYIIKDYFNKPLQIMDLFYDEKSGSKNLKQKQEEANKFLNRFYEKLVKNSKEQLMNNRKYQLLVEVYNKLNDKEELTFKRELEINGQKVMLNFAIISSLIKSKSKYCGVTIYHKDRAIYHGPNDNVHGNMQFVEVKTGSGQNMRYRWLYGDINLTGIEKPDQNKKDFVWKAGSKEQLEDQLKEIFDELEDVLIEISKIDDIKSNTKPNKEEIWIIKKDLKNKFETHLLEPPKAFEEDGMFVASYPLNLFNERFEIKICESYNDNINFMDIEIDNNNITVNIEAENKFWKPLIRNQYFKGVLLFPLATCFGILKWLNNDYNKTKLHELGCNDEKDFISILSKIVQMVNN